MRPVDIAYDTGFNAFEMIGAKHVDTVVADAAIFGIETLVVAVAELIIDTQAIAKLAVFTVRPVVARIEIKAETILIAQQVSVFIKIGVNVIETVVVIVGSVSVEPAIQADAEVVTVVVKLLGVVCSKMAETRLRKGCVAHAVGQNAVDGLQKEGLLFAAAAKTAIVIVEAASIEGDVARRVNLIVDIHENIAADATVVFFLGCRLVPHRVIQAFSNGVLELQFPTVGRVNSVAVTP